MINRYYIEQVQRDIQAGVTYPDRWPEPGEPGYEAPVEEDQVDENGPAPTRWWELEGLTFEQALRGGR